MKRLLAISTPRQRLALGACLLVALALIVADVALLHAQAAGPVAFQAQPQPIVYDGRYIPVGIIFVAMLVIGAWTARGLRSREH